MGWSPEAIKKVLDFKNNISSEGKVECIDINLVISSYLIMFGCRCQEEPMRHRFRLRNWSKKSNTSKIVEIQILGAQGIHCLQTFWKNPCHQKNGYRQQSSSSMQQGWILIFQNGRWNQQIPFDCSLAETLIVRFTRSHSSGARHHQVTHRDPSIC